MRWTRCYLWQPEDNKKQIEYLVVAYEDERQKVKLSLRQADILDALAKDEVLCKQGGCVPDLQKLEQYPHLSRLLIPHSDTSQSQRCPTDISPRIWSVHVGSNTRETVGYWLQGPFGC